MSRSCGVGTCCKVIECRMFSSANRYPSRVRDRPSPGHALIIGADMTHKFQSGQTVRLSRSLSYRSAANGDYKVVRQLPDGGGELQYRIKSVSEPHERVVKESDLEKA